MNYYEVHYSWDKLTPGGVVNQVYKRKGNAERKAAELKAQGYRTVAVKPVIIRKEQ